MQQLQGLLIL